jgi:cytochrome c peroxidase
LFHSAQVGCAGCHAGDALTTNTNEDVGTGAAFQVPSLRGVLYRVAYFHDGREPTLERVSPALATRTLALDDAARADLVSYVRSL